MKYLLALLLALMPSVALAQRDATWREFRPGEPVTLRPDRAYILLRWNKPARGPVAPPVLMRLPTPDDLRQHEAARQTAFAAAREKADARRNAIIRSNANLPAEARKPVPPELTMETFAFEDRSTPPNIVPAVRDYVRGEAGGIRLIEAMPGTYLILGMGFSSDGGMLTCLCFGTVKFAAAPGIITDLGHVLTDAKGTPSAIPELLEVSSLPVDPGIALPVITVRPYADGMVVPPALAGLPRVPADYRAVGKFRNNFGWTIDRMAPVRGVLAYDGERVIDLKAEPVNRQESQ